MQRTELTLVIAGAFLFAMALGWVLRWIFSRLNGVGGPNPASSNELAARLHTAEEARDAAIREKDETMRALKNRLDQAEAELAAAMDGLGTARREAEELRRALEGR